MEQNKLLEIIKQFDNSKFRSRFHLKEADKKYVNEKGMDTIRTHAAELIAKRLAPAIVPNDGKQTPTKGHPVFIAQHATACCCRECLSKWHHILKDKKLTETEQKYVVDVIMAWIEREMEGYEPAKEEDGQLTFDFE